MIKKLLMLFLLIAFYLFCPSPTLAIDLTETNDSIIDQVNFTFDVASLNVQTYTVDPETDSLYYDSKKTYAEDNDRSQILEMRVASGYSTTYEYVVAPYEMTILLDEKVLNVIPGNKDFDNIAFNVNVEGECDVLGSWLDPVPIKDANGNFITSYALDIALSSACSEKFLRKTISTKGVFFKVRLYKGQTIYDLAGEAFRKFQFIERTGKKCLIEFTGFTDGADTNSKVGLTITDIDSLGYSSSLFMNENLKVNGLVEPESQIDIGYLPVNKSGHLFEVRSNSLEKNLLCSRLLPVVGEGEELIIPGENNTSSTLTLNLATTTTIPLCDSIPESADCNGISCRAKCQKCETAKEVWTGLGCMPTDVGGLVKILFSTFTGVLGALIFACVFLNGLKIMSSKGNPEAMKKAQEALTSCLVGFVVLTLSVVFLKIVGVDILQLPGWS